MQNITLPRALATRLLPVVCALAGIAGSAQAQTVVVIDNGSPGFSGGAWGGPWRSSTAGSATFTGANHLVADGISASNTIDNESPQFSTTGNWTKRTDATEMFGANYHGAQSVNRVRKHYPTLIVDNRTYRPGGSNVTGANQWATSSTISGFYGKDYAYSEPGTSSYPKVAYYSVASRSVGNLGDQITMKLSARWPASPTNATNVKIRFKNLYDQVLGEYTVNQQLSSGEWTDLGKVNISVGVDYRVEFDATYANGRVIADAIKLQPVEDFTPEVARWELPSNLWGTYEVYARSPKKMYGQTFTAWSVVGGKGIDFPSGSTSQGERQGEWRLLGQVELQGLQKNYVQLDDFSSSSESLRADVITYVPQYSFPTATWSLDTMDRPTNVYVSWSADATRATDARYVVVTYGPFTSTYRNCFDTRTSVIVNQRDTVEASRKFLGTFTSNRACGPMKVELMPNTSTGTLSADAVSFEMQ